MKFFYPLKDFHIYHVFDKTDDEDFRLIPQGSVHEFNWDVPEIEVWEVKDLTFSLYATLEEGDDFTVDYEEKSIILDESVYDDLHSYTKETSRKFILQSNIRKYQSISDTTMGEREITAEKGS